MRSQTNLDLAALLEDTKQTLANLDDEHRYETQKLEQGRTGAVLKSALVANLRLRHRKRREPYARLIAELQKRIASATRESLKATG